MQQLISHLLNICDNVYRQNAFVYTGRGNNMKIATMLYHASSPDLAPQGRARYGNVAV